MSKVLLKLPYLLFFVFISSGIFSKPLEIKDKNLSIEFKSESMFRQYIDYNKNELLGSLKNGYLKNLTLMLDENKTYNYSQIKKILDESIGKEGSNNLTLLFKEFRGIKKNIKITFASDELSFEELKKAFLFNMNGFNVNIEGKSFSLTTVSDLIYLINLKGMKSLKLKGINVDIGLPLSNIKKSKIDGFIGFFLNKKNLNVDKVTESNFFSEANNSDKDTKKTYNLMRSIFIDYIFPENGGVKAKELNIFYNKKKEFSIRRYKNKIVKLIVSSRPENESDYVEYISNLLLFNKSFNSIKLDYPLSFSSIERFIINLCLIKNKKIKKLIVSDEINKKQSDKKVISFKSLNELLTDLFRKYNSQEYTSKFPVYNLNKKNNKFTMEYSYLDYCMYGKLSNKIDKPNAYKKDLSNDNYIPRNLFEVLKKLKKEIEKLVIPNDYNKKFYNYYIDTYLKFFDDNTNKNTLTISEIPFNPNEFFEILKYVCFYKDKKALGIRKKVKKIENVIIQNQKIDDQYLIKISNGLLLLLPKVKKINLSNNNITNFGCLSEIFNKYKKEVILDLSNNEVSDFNIKIKKIKRRKSFHMSPSSLRSSRYEEVNDKITEKNNIKDLIIENKKKSPTKLLLKVTNSKKSRSLESESVRVTTKPLKRRESFKIEQKNTLEELNKEENNSYNNNFGSKKQNYFILSCKNLNLSGNKIDSEFLKSFIKDIENYKKENKKIKLEHLDLTNNKIEEVDIELIEYIIKIIPDLNIIIPGLNIKPKKIGEENNINKKEKKKKIRRSIFSKTK